MLGDVSGDGILTANDAAFILQYALDPSIADSGEYDFTKADVDGNGIVTANDASYVLQKTLDSSFVFPTAA
jgi:hypothetical protein